MVVMSDHSSSTPAPPTLKAVIARVRAWVRSQPRGKRRIAAAGNLAPNTLARVEAEGWQPSLATLARLEAMIPADWMPPAP